MLILGKENTLSGNKNMRAHQMKSFKRKRKGNLDVTLLGRRAPSKPVEPGHIMVLMYWLDTSAILTLGWYRLQINNRGIPKVNGSRRSSTWGGRESSDLNKRSPGRNLERWGLETSQSYLECERSQKTIRCELEIDRPSTSSLRQTLSIRCTWYY